MRSIGILELIVIAVVVVFARAIWLVVRKIQSPPSPLGSRQCPHCGQRIPDIGSFCPICGLKIV